MKMVKAIIRPEKFPDVKNSLFDIGVVSLTTKNVKGRGNQKGLVQQWRGREYCVELLDKMELEIVIIDDMVEKVVDAIVNSAKTGEPGDGKIFIVPIEDVVRIRTGERRSSALH
ncbi:MAG TPA: P-II family nitrogen regulator [Methanosarcinaceae archaeon]|nr:P-II family nitrogen regulator [Methanosarcinaceae archaeon]